MRKIDLHIHTKPTKWDAEFTFSLDVLSKYTRQLELDCIAITNHNCFDLKQFQLIADTLKIISLPGIEITIGQNKGHLLLISDYDEIEDFSIKCNIIEQKTSEDDESIDIQFLQDTFENLSKYLIIPHYE